MSKHSKKCCSQSFDYTWSMAGVFNPKYVFFKCKDSPPGTIIFMKEPSLEYVEWGNVVEAKKMHSGHKDWETVIDWYNSYDAIKNESDDFVEKYYNLLKSDIGLGIETDLCLSEIKTVCNEYTTDELIFKICVPYGPKAEVSKTQFMNYVLLLPNFIRDLAYHNIFVSYYKSLPKIATVDENQNSIEVKFKITKFSWIPFCLILQKDILKSDVAGKSNYLLSVINNSNEYAPFSVTAAHDLDLFNSFYKKFVLEESKPLYINTEIDVNQFIKESHKRKIKFQ